KGDRGRGACDRRGDVCRAKRPLPVQPGMRHRASLAALPRVPTTRKNATLPCRPAWIAASPGLSRWLACNEVAQYRRPSAAAKERPSFPRVRCVAGRACQETPDDNKQALAGARCEIRVRKEQIGSIAQYNPPGHTSDMPIRPTAKKTGPPPIPLSGDWRRAGRFTANYPELAGGALRFDFLLRSCAQAGNRRFVRAARHEPDFHAPVLRALACRTLACPFLHRTIGERHGRV